MLKNPFRNNDNAQGGKRKTTLYHNQWHLFIKRHRKALSDSLERLKKYSYSSFLTCLVIAVTLTLPLLLIVMLSNLETLNTGMTDSAKISLYLDLGASSQAINDLALNLQTQDTVAQIDYISPAEGLSEFAKSIGLGTALNGLSDNPLPAVLVITPSMAYQTPEKIRGLMEQFKTLPLVDEVQLDLDWVKRLFAIIHLLRSIVIGVAVILCIGVIIIVGNTIKFAIHHYQDEIDVMKLIGASDALIRRPFLYTGVFYGFGGVLMALLIIAIFFIFLNGRIGELAQAFSANFSLSFFGLGEILLICLTGSLLGLAGAWLVVNRYIQNSHAF